MCVRRQTCRPGLFSPPAPSLTGTLLITSCRCCLLGPGAAVVKPQLHAFFPFSFLCTQLPLRRFHIIYRFLRSDCRLINKNPKKLSRFRLLSRGTGFPHPAAARHYLSLLLLSVFKLQPQRKSVEEHVELALDSERPKGLEDCQGKLYFL